MNQYSEMTYQRQLKLGTRYVTVDVQSILPNIWSSRQHSRAQALIKDFITWFLTQQHLVRIKQNFEAGKYEMIETDHQNFFVIGVSWLVPDSFQ